MSAWGRYFAAFGMALACGVGGGGSKTAAAPPEPALTRLPIDDFESPRRYGPLDQTLPRRSRGGLEWRREPCERSGADGHCLYLRYQFTPGIAQQVNLRIDLRDLDTSAYDHLELWIKGDEPAGYSPALKVGLRRPKTGDSRLMEDATQVVTGINAEWKHVVVPLDRMTGIQEWTHLSAFFVALESRRAGAATRGAYWIDDVALLKTGRRGPTVYDQVVPRKKRAWEKSVGGAEAAKPLVAARLAGWPERLLADRSGLPRSDREFLERLARDTWRGMRALSDRENGLPIDHVVFSGGRGSGSGEGRLGPDSSPASSATLTAPAPASSTSALTAPAPDSIGDYTNITNVGLYLIAIASAHELGLVSTEEATGLCGKVLDTLDRLDAHQGFFFNYYDTTTLERTSNFISFVDSSWLTAGLMVVRMTFPDLRERCTKLIDRQNYGFFYDEVAQQMSHGYYVNVDSRSEYHYGLLYTEPRLGSLIAIGKGDAPEEHWFALVRTYPPEADWQSQKPTRWKAKTVRGHTLESGTYEWKGLRYVPSWGGSMFEALMPALVLDEQRYAPASLGRNDETHATVQRRYAAEELGYPVWGLSPSAKPGGGGYGEYGVKPLGTLGYRPGAVAPYAAALALAVLPDAAAADLRALAERYDVYGEYGFYDSLDPKSGQVAYQYLVLDQAMILISAANALKAHCIQQRFASDPIAQRALPVIGDENFFD